MSFSHGSPLTGSCHTLVITGNMNQHQGLSVSRTKLHLGSGIPIKSLLKIKTIRSVSKLSQICEYRYFTKAALCLPIT